MLHQKCPTENRTIFILQRALISITSPCVRISTSAKKIATLQTSLGWWKKHPKAPMFDGMDAIACWMAFWKHLWLHCTEKQGHSSASNCIACMDMIPITNLQCTCGDVTGYRYNSRFKDVWIPCAGCASAKKLQRFTAACRAVGGRSWLFGGYLLILIRGRCLGDDPILFIKLSMAHAWHVVWWNKVSLVSVKLCRFRAQILTSCEGTSPRDIHFSSPHKLFGQMKSNHTMP